MIKMKNQIIMMKSNINENETDNDNDNEDDGLLQSNKPSSANIMFLISIVFLIISVLPITFKKLFKHLKFMKRRLKRFREDRKYKKKNQASDSNENENENDCLIQGDGDDDSHSPITIDQPTSNNSSSSNQSKTQVHSNLSAAQSSELISNKRNRNGSNFRKVNRIKNNGDDEDDNNMVFKSCKDGDFINSESFWRSVKVSKILIVILISASIVLRFFQLGYHLISIISSHNKSKRKDSNSLNFYQPLTDLIIILTWSIICHHGLLKSLKVRSVNHHWRSVIYASTLITFYGSWRICSLLLPDNPLKEPVLELYDFQWWLIFIEVILGLMMIFISLTINRAPRMIYRSPFSTDHVQIPQNDDDDRQESNVEDDEERNLTMINNLKIDESKPDGNVTLIASCSIIDYLFFNWVTPVVRIGMKKSSLERSDLPYLTSDFRSFNLFKKVKDNISKASVGQIGLMKFVGKSPRWMNPLLWRVLKINQTAFLTQAALALLNSVLYYAPAFFLRKIIAFLEISHDSKKVSIGYSYCVGLLLSMLFESIVSGQLWYLSNSVLCARIRIQLNTAIYAKTLRRKVMTGPSTSAEQESNIATPAQSTTTLPSELDSNQASNTATGTSRKKHINDDTPESIISKQKKSLKPEQIGLGTKSQVLNLFTIDADRVADFGMSCFSLIDAPSEVIIGTIFLYDLLGFASIVGIAISILFIPLNHYTSKWYATVQDNLMVARDRRVSLMNEVLSSIRMIKYMAWEIPFEKKILRSREYELRQLRKNFLLEVSFNFIWLASPIFCVLTSFLWFTKVESRELTPAIAFTSLAVFSELKFALNTLPETFINALQCLVSLHRIERYLASPECTTDTNLTADLLETENSSLSSPSPSSSSSSFFSAANAAKLKDNLKKIEDPQNSILPPLQLCMRNATVTWPTENPVEEIQSGTRTPLTPSRRTFYLEDISVDFPENQITLICGSLGSGKTLLLLALLGEAELLAGQIICPRSPPNVIGYMTHLQQISEREWQLPICAYAPQSAWLQNASIRSNILFGLPYAKERYEATLYACSLISDLEILEDGDQTEIGERGVNLSGGQKARISLARAVYSRASVLLLDDVLSAVDAHTARHIVENCFKGPLLKNRTLIIVSHHVQLCSTVASQVVFLESGSIEFCASSEEFLQSKKFRALCGLDHGDDEDGTPSKKKKIVGAGSPATKLTSHTPTPKKLTDKVFQNAAKTSEAKEESPPPPKFDEDGNSDESESESESDEEAIESKPARKLVEEESRAVGRVHGDVFKLYLGSMSTGILATWIFWFVFALVFLGNKALTVLETYVLSLWSGSNDHGSGESHSTSTLTSNSSHIGILSADHSVDFYLGLYSAVSLVNVIVSTIRWLVLYEGTLKASEKLYERILHGILRCPLRFFDTVPLGRLLNRFGKDFEGIDSSLPDNLGHSLIYSLDVATTIASVTAVTPAFLVAFCLISVLYWHYGRQYTHIARELRRLDSVTKSPLFNSYSETVSGVCVIRAFGGCSRALALVFDRIDTNVSFYFYLWSVNRWLSIRYSLLASGIVGLTGFFLLTERNRINASLAGFALTFALNISGDMLYLVRRVTALELSMVSVERVKEFSEIESEAPEIIEPRPSANWPHSGEVVVENLTVRYAPELPDVLHSINFHVPAGGKVGIVGATGCGKSTLAQSFFRFVEAWDGCIRIDGIDIKDIGLRDLRSRLTIIPQDPIILSGTLRSTLDVFDEYPDSDIYSALRRVNLIPSEDDEVDDSPNNNDESDEDDDYNANIFRNLETLVSEQGQNFSQGQRQLLCMARGLLKRSKVVLMDEATSSIDNRSDALISLAIRQEFKDSTLLVIAHRLRTIIDFDYVLVLDGGRVIEYDRPSKLICNQSSRFHNLCRSTGKKEFKALYRMAVGESPQNL